jgi:hypothetical protein
MELVSEGHPLLMSRFRNPHPWRIMTAVFGGVLFCSILLQKLFSPVGDAMLQAADRRAATITGTIAESQSESGRLALYDGRSAYRLPDQEKVRTYAGRRVRVSGAIHQATGIFDIRTIELVDLQNSRLDHAPASQ